MTIDQDSKGRARTPFVVVPEFTRPLHALAACAALLVACHQRAAPAARFTAAEPAVGAGPGVIELDPQALPGRTPVSVEPTAMHARIDALPRVGSAPLSQGSVPGYPGHPALPHSGTSAFGANNPGGQGGALLHVTSLAESGPGTLRAALETPGPRIVVFDVAGVIDLGLQSLEVSLPFLTVDGHSGPAPGITLIRGSISVKSHDVRISHLRVRPGDAGQAPGSGWEPDGISIWGPDAHDILIENCSVSWAVDENLSVSSWNPPQDAPQRVTIRDCILAEGLRNSTHSEGAHSSGAIIRGQEVAVEGCLFAHNTRRNPEFRGGATGIVVNNLIYDPEVAAVQEALGSSLAVVGNTYLHGLDTASGARLLKGRGRAYLDENIALDVLGSPVDIVDEDDFRILPWPYLWRGSAYQPLPPGAVEAHVLLNAGAWPEQRDAIDQRIVNQLVQRTGNVIDSQDDVGGYP